MPFFSLPTVVQERPLLSPVACKLGRELLCDFLTTFFSCLSDTLIQPYRHFASIVVVTDKDQADVDRHNCCFMITPLDPNPYTRPLLLRFCATQKSRSKMDTSLYMSSVDGWVVRYCSHFLLYSIYINQGLVCICRSWQIRVITKKLLNKQTFANSF